MPELTSEVALCLKRSKPVIVLPARQSVVDGDGTYFLCNLDQNVAITMYTVCFYAASKGCKRLEHPGVVLRKALEETLVHFYPLAGKLAISQEGKLHVVCNGEGARFVEAEFDASISELGENLDYDFAFIRQLVCASPPKVITPLDIPLLMIQVTRFNCGGFSIGISMNHCMADGLSASQFLISWGEIARGLPLSVPPALDRTMLKARDPLQIEFDHLEFAEIDHISSNSEDLHCQLHNRHDIAFSSFCFDSQALRSLKQQILKEGELNRCSTFEALSGFIWRARTQALGMASTQKTKLLFAVDGRSRLQPPLPKGFHGNGIVLTCAVASAGELVSNKLSYAVGLVQEAITMVTDAYMRSAIDYYEKTRARPTLNSTVVITSWCRLPFRKADFGWGEAVECIPAGAPQPEVIFFLEHGKDGNGIKVLLGLPTFALTTIHDLIQQLHSDRCNAD